MMEEDLKLISPGEIRVRIAPSPTGHLHIGTARAALFNYLFAKKYEGSFILRIEDTDIERSKKEWEEEIIEGLKWLGIEWSEGPDIGGDYGPYRQSERREIYSKYIQKLLKEDKAYYCFCSKEKLETQKQYQMSIGETPRYSGKCRDISPQKVKEYLEAEKPFIIRFKTPSKKIAFQDIIRGKIEFDTALFGDFCIAKSFTDPLYNFACVIDDFEMKITHVIRGEDHISNTPKQILLQEALGLPQPKFAHLPLILGEDRSKLSKRHGAISIAEYRKAGYLPEALVNFITLLSWNPGTEREIFSMPSLIKEFSIEKIQKSGAVFNIRKLDWINGFYIRQTSTKKLTELCLPYLIETGLIKPIFGEIQYPPAYGARGIVQKYQIFETGKEINLKTLQRIVSIYQERLKKLSEIPELTHFFFRKNLKYDKKLLRWKDTEDKEIKNILKKLKKILSKIKSENWTEKNLTDILIAEADKIGDRGKILWPLRVALTGEKASAGPFEIATILGKERTLQRLNQAYDIL
jgi:glutamyl-tRNA synthetase